MLNLFCECSPSDLASLFSVRTRVIKTGNPKKREGTAWTRLSKAKSRAVGAHQICANVPSALIGL